MADENKTEVKKQVSGAVNPVVTKTKYSKQYYIMFFAIMITAFVVIYWICNYTRLKELFQIMTYTALALLTAELITKKYLNL